MAIVGSRTFADYALLERTMADLPRPSSIVSGGGKGADTLGAQYARAHDIPLVELLPDWKQYGKAAGMLRNSDIVKAADVVVAFWDGQSPGTRDSLAKATKAGKRVLIVKF